MPLAPRRAPDMSERARMLWMFDGAEALGVITKDTADACRALVRCELPWVGDTFDVEPSTWTVDAFLDEPNTGLAGVTETTADGRVHRFTLPTPLLWAAMRGAFEMRSGQVSTDSAESTER